MRLTVAVGIFSERAGRGLCDEAVGVEDDVLKGEPHEALPNVAPRVCEVEDGRGHGVRARMLLVADATVEEGDCRGDALQEARSCVGERPDVAQPVVLRTLVAERVAEYADERDFRVAAVGALESAETAEDCEELRVATDGERLDAEGRRADGLVRERVFALEFFTFERGRDLRRGTARRQKREED